jgi:hypothetical protein
MKKIGCLLAVAAAVSFAPPVMAQTSNGGIAIGNPQASQAQVPQPPDGNVNWKGVGIGAGTVAGNVLYVPAKIVYGILGGLTGGASYLLTGGNTQTANTIWRSSLGGDYVLTPDMVSGQKPIHFSGPTMTAPDSSPVAAPATNPAPASAAAPAHTASTYSSAPAGNASANGYPASGSAVAQPADHGTGPVSSSGPDSFGSSRNRGPAGVPVTALPGTSIE